MTKHVAFTVPDERPKRLLALSSKSAHRFTESLKFALFNYLTSLDRPQTAMLPREIHRRTVELEIISLCETMLEFPAFNLYGDRKKFIRCCYRNVLIQLMLEWKARLLCALARSHAKRSFRVMTLGWLYRSSRLNHLTRPCSESLPAA